MISMKHKFPKRETSGGRALVTPWARLTKGFKTVLMEHNINCLFITSTFIKLNKLKTAISDCLVKIKSSHL
jgi:hypothetical protein